MEQVQTPFLDFAPIAMAAVIQCQEILFEYGLSGKADAQDCLTQLTQILCNKRMIKATSKAVESL